MYFLRVAIVVLFQLSILGCYSEPQGGDGALAYFRYSDVLNSGSEYTYYEELYYEPEQEVYSVKLFKEGQSGERVAILKYQVSLDEKSSHHYLATIEQLSVLNYDEFSKLLVLNAYGVFYRFLAFESEPYSVEIYMFKNSKQLCYMRITKGVLSCYRAFESVSADSMLP